MSWWQFFDLLEKTRDLAQFYIQTLKETSEDIMDALAIVLNGRALALTEKEMRRLEDLLYYIREVQVCLQQGDMEYLQDHSAKTLSVDTVREVLGKHGIVYPQHILLLPNGEELWERIHHGQLTCAELVALIQECKEKIP